MWRSENTTSPRASFRSLLLPEFREGREQKRSRRSLRQRKHLYLRLLLLLLSILLVAACDNNMSDQAKCKPYAEIDGLENGACAQPLPDGVVARDAIVDNDPLRTGMSGDNYVSDLPVDVTQDLLARGQEEYTVFCQPCHGAAGYGDGVIVQYGFPAPPSLHSIAVTMLLPGFIFDVISNGFGRMYSYGQEIAVPDRWAVVAYVQALQLSQKASVDSLPDSDREQLPQ